MIDSIGTILVALLAIVAVGAVLLCYVVWRSNRRMEDAAAEMADAAQPQKAGGGGPKPVK